MGTSTGQVQGRGEVVKCDSVGGGGIPEDSSSQQLLVNMVITACSAYWYMYVVYSYSVHVPPLPLLPPSLGW